MKNIMIRFLNGFCYSIAITVMIQQIVVGITGTSFMLPEYAARFDNIVFAYTVQLLLIGLMSAVAAAGSMIMEIKRIGLIVQSILYFVLMLGTWIPIACYLWGFHKYTASMVSSLLSIVVTYSICWGIQYKICVRDVAEINRRLKEKQVV